MSTTTTTTERRDGGRSATGALRGCALHLLASPYPDGLRHILSLDRDPGTYTRSLTPAELAALARTNPDDGVHEDALQIVCDLTVALAALCGTGAVITRVETRTGRETRFVEFALVSPAELTELGRVAGELIAVVGAVAQ